MPPVTGMLSDEQIAAALTYIRREWGHTASAVTASDVRETRQSQTHKGPWTEAELSGLLAGGGGRIFVVARTNLSDGADDRAGGQRAVADDRGDGKIAGHAGP